MEQSLSVLLPLPGGREVQLFRLKSPVVHLRVLCRAASRIALFCSAFSIFSVLYGILYEFFSFFFPIRNLVEKTHLFIAIPSTSGALQAGSTRLAAGDVWGMRQMDAELPDLGEATQSIRFSNSNTEELASAL